MRSGTVVAERYLMDRRLGAGGMGEVWEAEDRLLHRRVAVKLLHEPDAGARARFLREARAAAGLQHPGVVVVHDFGEFDEQPFLVMELLRGRSLESGPGALAPTVGQVAEIGARVAEALAVAHAAGLVHRDVKPSNLFRTEDGTVKLLDFGIAHHRPLDGDGAAERTAAVGTPAYLAPEQLGGGPLDARADLYALGGTLYALLAGHPPFRGRSTAELVHQQLYAVPPSLRALRPDVPAELEALLLGLLAKDPARRPAGAAQVAEQLAALAERLTGTVRPRAVQPMPKGHRRLNRVTRVVLSVALLSVVAGWTAVRLGLPVGFDSEGSAVDPLFRPNTPTAAARPPWLRLGDCLDYTSPVAGNQVGPDTPVGWRAADCAGPHQAQVAKVETLRTPVNRAVWKSQPGVLLVGCDQARSAAEQAHPGGPRLAVVVLGPSEADWLSGAERYGYCTVHRADGAPLDLEVRPTAGPG
ncbi:serine/threonine-protein kinase [Kitasatospora sp. NPDC049258]|uniref:serine/threonine-protein kinase n=1 Tax=Kitasatospora sp. NPDC049258 TaxID=3155394 RepID=UPI003412C812